MELHICSQDFNKALHQIKVKFEAEIRRERTRRVVENASRTASRARIAVVTRAMRGRSFRGETVSVETV